MTFLDMDRPRRMQMGFTLAHQDTHAPLLTGFASDHDFRQIFAQLLEREVAKFDAPALLHAHWFQSALGPMIGVADATHLHLLEFADRKALKSEVQHLAKANKGTITFGQTAPMAQAEAELAAYFAGQSANFKTPMAPVASDFGHSVWRALVDIPAGQTRSYGQLARHMARPETTRAVARANGANQIAVLIPCHRVLGADGSLTGYGGGLWRKQKLLDIEARFWGN